jgi:hypothetical protein
MIHTFLKLEFSSSLVYATLCLSLLGTCGCSGDQGVEVSGTVRLDGETLPGGKVTFYHPTKPGRNVSGYIQPDGTYRVHFVPRGSVKATVVALPPRLKTTGPAKPGRNVPKVPDMPLKYSDPSTTDLVFIIRSDTEDLNIELHK